MDENLVHFLWHSIAFKILREYYCSCKHLTATHTIVLPLELLQEQCPNEKRSFTYFTNSRVHAAKRAFCRHLKIRRDHHWIHQDEKSKNSGRSIWMSTFHVTLKSNLWQLFFAKYGHTDHLFDFLRSSAKLGSSGTVMAFWWHCVKVCK